MIVSAADGGGQKADACASEGVRCRRRDEVMQMHVRMLDMESGGNRTGSAFRLPLPASEDDALAYVSSLQIGVRAISAGTDCSCLLVVVFMKKAELVVG